jgi:capsular polysaccharide biosynthesis protein
MKRLKIIIVILVILFFVIGCTTIIVFSPKFAPSVSIIKYQDSIKARDTINK